MKRSNRRSHRTTILKSGGMMRRGFLLLFVLSIPVTFSPEQQEGDGYSSLRPATASLEATGIILERLQRSRRGDKKFAAICCRLGIAYRNGPGVVVLDRICASRQKTVVYLRTIGLKNVCTYPPTTMIRDGKGRHYPMIRYRGIPNCKNGSTNKENVKFVWVFKPLSQGVTEITLLEQYSPALSGLSFWIWRDVKVEQCHF